ncbi:MAG: hypothetical protein ACR2QW_00955 [bacterium]
MAVKRQNEAPVDDVYCVVREKHCIGRQEFRTQKVKEYLAEQGSEEYDKMNRE